MRLISGRCVVGAFKDALYLLILHIAWESMRLIAEIRRVQRTCIDIHNIVLSLSV